MEFRSARFPDRRSKGRRSDPTAAFEERQSVADASNKTGLPGIVDARPQNIAQGERECRRTQIDTAPWARPSKSGITHRAKSQIRWS